MAVEPDNPTFVLAVLGDLHLDPADMRAHEEARDQITRQMEAEAFLMETENLHVVSLGDLGAYGSAGTTECFELARDYLEGFQAPIDIVSGNHDLEGLGEFATDRENLAAFQAAFDKDTPQFSTVIAEKTLCLGLSTVRFRDAEGSSHEIFIDEDQMRWFERELASHPAEDDWKVIVFSHAPPMGSGLRVVQGVHIKNQCAWLNHSVGDRERRHFVRMCRKYRQVKAWFSGHFHLSHDYEDSISVVDGCAFVQVGVIGEKSTRDGRRQTRLVRGTEDCLKVYTVSHHVEGAKDARLDLTLNYDDPTHPVIAHGHEDYDHSSWFSAYMPEEEDGCYLDHKQLASDGGAVAPGAYTGDVQCWWHMEDGRVLGVHDGMVVEYDQELLAPIGVVRDREQLRGRDVVVIEGGRAVMLVPKEGSGDSSDVEVIHPNSKGGYSTVFQRNKAVRTKEMEREAMAQRRNVTFEEVFATQKEDWYNAAAGGARGGSSELQEYGALTRKGHNPGATVAQQYQYTVHRGTGMRRPKSSHRRGGGGCARFSSGKCGLLLCGLPLVVLSYAVFGWRAWHRRGGPIASAARRGCFGTQDERKRYGGGGTGPLRNIASAHLQPDQLADGLCGGRKVVAFAVTLTKEGNHLDGAVVLATSVDRSCATSEFLCDLVAFLHDDIGLETEGVLRRLGFRVMRPGLPLDLEDIEDKETRDRVKSGGCCGPAELMKFFAYTLTDYHRVVHLDTDAVILQPLDDLLDAKESLLYTTDLNMGDERKTPVMPVQGGFLVIRPDLEVFEDLVQVLKTTRHSREGWGGSMIGLFWGGISVQGILPYYYEHRAPPGITYRAVDRCVYNNMVDRPDCMAADVSSVRSAHFTNCNKPWTCLYPHRKQPLCSLLTERWFKLRTRAEGALALPPTEPCPTGYGSAYNPMALVTPKAGGPLSKGP
eukprot:g20287.t1